MTSNYPSPERDYTVLVRCFTFNQSKYIEDALNGFVMQQTTFPFVCLVMDDASTDGEQEVIKTWMERECDMAKAKHIDIPTADIIIVLHKTNRNCTMVFYLLKENLFRQKEKKMEHVAPWREHCRYEALCEGDDYWIDPRKLQKQVDVLESDEGISMCWTDAFQENRNGTRKAYNRYLCDTISPMEDIIEKGGDFVPTCSIVLRTEVFASLPKITKSLYVGDYPLQVWSAYSGVVYYLKEQTCVYRFMSVGSWTSNHCGKRDKKKIMNHYENEKKMLQVLNEITYWKFRTSFEKRAAIILFNLLIEAKEYSKAKKYLDYQHKYNVHIDKVIALRIMGFPILANLLQLVRKMYVKIKKSL